MSSLAPKTCQTRLLLEVGRRQFAQVLTALPDEAFDRRGLHNRRGELMVGGLVKEYVEHVNHHLAFLAGKRARLGMPLGPAGGVR
jgi:hypothetical protein